VNNAAFGEQRLRRSGFLRLCRLILEKQVKTNFPDVCMEQSATGPSCPVSTTMSGVGWLFFLKQ